jgi:telomere length regulation protein
MKLSNVGAFPPSSMFAPSQPTFFAHVLDTVRTRLAQPNARTYSKLWTDVLSSIPSSMTLQTILHSFFAHLEPPAPALDASPPVRVRVKREAELMRGVVDGDSAVWDAVVAVALGQDWGEGYARIFACWAAGAKGSVDEAGSDTLRVMFCMALTLR